MACETGTRLAAGIRAKAAELKAACAAVSDPDAAPAGRWTPREILSHLAGPKDRSLLELFGRFTAEDVPLIELVPEQTYMTDERRAMPFAQLVELALQRYAGVADYAETLSEAEFARTARIPIFKDRPIGEYPTLAAVVDGFGMYHVQMHIDHLREVLAGK